MKEFLNAILGDDISNLTCPNPKCRSQSMRFQAYESGYVNGRKKTLECQHCFSRYHVDDALQGFEYPGEPEKGKNRKDD